MAKDIFDTILEKDFHLLTPQELAEMAEFCKTEEEFLAMKHVLAHSKSIAEGPKLSPKDATKEKLDTLFDSTYGTTRKFTPFYLNSIVQIAAVVVVGFAVWMFVSKSNELEPVRTAENTSPKEKENSVEEEPIERNNQVKKENHPDSITLKTIGSNGNDFEYTTESTYKPDYDGVVDDSHRTTLFSVFDTSKEKISEDVIAETDSSFEESEYVAMELSDKKREKTFSKVSAPASSVKDISVSESKSPYKNQALTSMNVSEQKNVMDYLVARY